MPGYRLIWSGGGCPPSHRQGYLQAPTVRFLEGYATCSVLRSYAALRGLCIRGA